MNTNRRIIVLLVSVFLITSLFSCQKKNDTEPATGTITFSLSSTDDFSTLKSALKDSITNDSLPFTSLQILITVEDLNGQLILKDKLIPLYSFGNSFVSEQIEIKSGDYYLRKFMVINQFGSVIYATPLSGSPIAYLVNQPLPIFFSVAPGETSTLSPEVISVGSLTPSEFGYASFIAQVVNTFQFFVNVQIISPSSIIQPPLTNAELFISGQEGWSHYFQLDATVNQLEVRSSDSYEIVLFKEGFPEVKFNLSSTEILGTSEGKPYTIYIETNNYNTLILQPGKDDGKDSWITDIQPDQNFGDYHYFESSFLSDSVLAVMRTTRSLIYFDIGEIPKSATIHKVTLTFHYDIPIYWEFDSSWILRNKKCNCLLPGAVLQQIIEPWEENEVNWSNQPATTEIGQVMLFPFVKNANFIDIDVTSLFVPDPNIDSIPQPNYGIMMKLFPEEIYPGFRFVSGDYPEEFPRPKLTVYYSLP